MAACSGSGWDSASDSGADSPSGSAPNPRAGDASTEDRTITVDATSDAVFADGVADVTADVKVDAETDAVTVDGEADAATVDAGADTVADGGADAAPAADAACANCPAGSTCYDGSCCTPTTCAEAVDSGLATGCARIDLGCGVHRSCVACPAGDLCEDDTCVACESYHPPDVVCGSVTCSGPTPVCCSSGTPSAYCTTASQCLYNGFEYGMFCDDTGDCREGQVCCGNYFVGPQGATFTYPGYCKNPLPYPYPCGTPWVNGPSSNFPWQNCQLDCECPSGVCSGGKCVPVDAGTD